MGVHIADIIPRVEVSLQDLKGKTIAIDALNTLYQFLTTIRQQDGTPLMDRSGRITSHISGLFYRNIALISEGINLIYVFDGFSSELKGKELERREDRKVIAQEKYEQAKEDSNFEDMRKYSQQTVRMSSEILQESKELLGAMGIPIVESLGEGEAEAASLVKRNYAWASASQDYDSLLYSTPRLIRNLTLSRKRRSSSGILIDTKIEMIELQKVLDSLQIDRDQLICLGIIVGTDFNPGGIRGIGQKRALEIVRKYKYPIKIFEFIEKSDKFEVTFDWQEVFKEFREFKENQKEPIEVQPINFDKIKEILIGRDFSEERIDSGLDKLKALQEKRKQKGLKDFF